MGIRGGSKLESFSLMQSLLGVIGYKSRYFGSLLKFEKFPHLSEVVTLLLLLRLSSPQTTGNNSTRLNYTLPFHHVCQMVRFAYRMSSPKRVLWGS
jgi:hypothetical protein